MTDKSNSNEEIGDQESSIQEEEHVEDENESSTEEETDPSSEDVKKTTAGSKKTEGMPAVSSSGTGPPVSSEDADIVSDDKLQEGEESDANDHVEQEGQEREKEVIDDRALEQNERHSDDEEVSEDDDGVPSVDVNAEEPPIDPDENIASPKNESQEDDETGTDG